MPYIKANFSHESKVPKSGQLPWKHIFFDPSWFYSLVPTGSGLETEGLGWGGRESFNLTTRQKRTVPEHSGLVVVEGGSLDSWVPTSPALCCPSDVQSNMLLCAQNLLEVLSRDWLEAEFSWVLTSPPQVQRVLNAWAHVRKKALNALPC